MARVTVEDCTERVPNSFELVILAAERTRDISSGAPLTVEAKNDKNPVIALREIAAGNIDTEVLREKLIANLQKNNKLDEISEENVYAENRDIALGVKGDYSDSSEDALFSFDEEIGIGIDTESDMDFSEDDIIEDDKL